MFLYQNTGTDADPKYAVGEVVKAEGKSLAVGSNAAPIIWDADHDGRRDLVVGAGDGRVLVYINQGTDASPDLRAATPVQVGAKDLRVSQNARPRYQDVDGNGTLDLVVGDGDGTVWAFRNTRSNQSPAYVPGTQSVADGKIIDVGDEAAPFFVDLDGDQVEDLVVGNADGELRRFWNIGTNQRPRFYPDCTIRVNSVARFAGPVVPLFWDMDLDGIRVANAELGKANWKHHDFEGRIVHREGTPRLFGDRPKDRLDDSDHPTHVMGTLAGSGLFSDLRDTAVGANGGTPYQWRGVAPKVGLVFLDNLVRDSLQRRNAIEKFNVHLINGSFALSEDGFYGEEAKIVDALVRGDLEAEMGAALNATPVIFSAGNNGSLDALFSYVLYGYFSITKQCKNALIVGNWDRTFAGGRLNTLSSLGPTTDGRIKPDVVAPGTGVVSCRNEVLNGYRPMTGTSMASPAAAGTLALLIDAWRREYAVSLSQARPLPSTLRALVIHSADDVDWETPGHAPAGALNPSSQNLDGPVMYFPGPDFATGWGMINAAAAVAEVKSKNIGQWQFTKTSGAPNFDERNVEFDVAEDGSRPLRVTLAWDDPAYPNDDPAKKDGYDLSTSAGLLVNDLDLVLIDPAGKVHYPYAPNQEIYSGDGTRPVPPEQQAPGTAIQIRRLLVPAVKDVYGQDYLRNGIDKTDTANQFRVQPIPVAAARRGRDHLNNVEQVYVERAVRGRWVARVVGFKIVEDYGPQRFSLIGPWGRDTEPPRVFVGEEPIELPPGAPTSSSLLRLVTVMDFRDPSPAVSVQLPPNLPVGDSTVEITATDAAGNTAVAKVKVRRKK